MEAESYLDAVYNGNKGQSSDYFSLGVVTTFIGGVLLLVGAYVTDETLTDSQNAIFKLGCCIAGSLLLIAALWSSFLAWQASSGEKSRYANEVEDLRRQLREAESDKRFLCNQTDVGRTSTNNPR